MINRNLYLTFEKDIISKKERFKISKKDFAELKYLFRKKIIFISGAAGSIGSQFSRDFFHHNFKPKKIIFFDKDENLLTELNRDLLLIKNFKKTSVEFICSDLTSIDLDKILIRKKVKIYLNFAAVKHVRSEENIESIKYMFKTNSIDFAPNKNNKLDAIFSISTDKTVNPSSILGVTKNLMEINLNKYSKDKFVSSVRFANVAFSNGSVLKYIVDRVIQRKPFGLPEKIRRFFITHKEASNLCFKSLLKRNNRKIIIPNPRVLKRDILITEVAKKILGKLNFKVKFTNNLKKTSNYKNKICNVLLTSLSDGQKLNEEIISNNENVITDKDPTVLKVKLPHYDKSIEKITKKILNSKNLKELKNILIGKFKSFSSPKKRINVSKTI